MEIPARYFWAQPLESFLPRKRADVCACITRDQIPIPDYCCRCGSSHPCSYPLKVKRIADSDLANKLAGLFIGHVGAGIEYLTRKKVGVPCCSSCLLLRRIGYTIASFFCLLGAAPIIALTTLDQTAKLQTTLTAESVAVLFLFFMPAIGVGIACWCSWRSLPVVIYAFGGQLYFEFWSPAYQQLILNLVPVEKGPVIPVNAA